MPYSSGLCKAEIRDWLRELRPATVLDIGAGSGTYSRLFRSLLPLSTWVAVEIHEPYVDQFELKQHYEQVIVMDALKLDIGANAFDVVVLGDVLEHLPRAEAATLLTLALFWSYKGVIASLPLGSCPQGPQHGNVYEEHKSEWTYSAFKHWTADFGIAKWSEGVVRKDADYAIGAFLWRV